ncbi:hypothetical protein FBQ62_18015 [Salmonella enterica]|nr:hypothetical protein [Salmonella enterica subsp. arizonae serovar 63:z4,z32:-]EAV7068365.1 hypothetical protein [Salmonella enterica subsp. arizonae serovar 63:z36:-]
MGRYHRKAVQSLANRCKALCVPFLSHANMTCRSIHFQMLNSQVFMCRQFNHIEITGIFKYEQRDICRLEYNKDSSLFFCDIASHISYGVI